MRLRFHLFRLQSKLPITLVYNKMRAEQGLSLIRNWHGFTTKEFLKFVDQYKPGRVAK